MMQSRSHLTEEVLTCLGVVIPAQVRRAHTTRACKHQAPPTQNQSWHLKSFAGAYHLPLHFYEDRFAKTCHFQYYLFKRKKCHSLIKGLLRSHGLFSIGRTGKTNTGVVRLFSPSSPWLVWELALVGLQCLQSPPRWARDSGRGGG